MEKVWLQDAVGGLGVECHAVQCRVQRFVGECERI
jgi:hypothetical protein